MPAHAGVGLARQVAEKQTHGDEADAADGLRSAEVGQGTLPLVDVAVSHLARLSELSMGFAEPGGALSHAPEVDRAGAGRDLAEGELPLLGEIPTAPPQRCKYHAINRCAEHTSARGRLS